MDFKPGEQVLVVLPYHLWEHDQIVPGVVLGTSGKTVRVRVGDKEIIRNKKYIYRSKNAS